MRLRLAVVLLPFGIRTALNRRMTTIADSAALILIDVQEGFDDSYWGPSSNPECEDNIAALVDAWHEKGGTVVVVRHESASPESPLHPDNPGSRLKPVAANATAELQVVKSVNSAFLGEPNLDEWLKARGSSQLVLCGIQTNMCVETTARMGGNLGYEVIVPLDATRTFDLAGAVGADGAQASATADELMRITGINLSGGGFAKVTTTDALLASMRV
ncbi:MAG TPA: cysteine hydrolase family protein [Homoserinimonas sp.]|nr:cysteine hydrolase family protein [Homoserinimonas sp.]